MMNNQHNLYHPCFNNTSKAFQHPSFPEGYLSHHIEVMKADKGNRQSRTSQCSIIASLPEIYNTFLLQSDIIPLLSSWVREYTTEIKSCQDLSIRYEIESIVTFIIIISQRFTLSFEELKASKIGKNINMFGKVLPEGNPTKKRCEDLVKKWRVIADCTSASASASMSQENTSDSLLGKKTIRINEIENDDCHGKKKQVIIETRHEVLKVIENEDNKPKESIHKTSPMTIIKSCVKTKKMPLIKRRVQFANEKTMNQVKLFRVTDQPNAPNITHSEYLQIQQEARLHPNKPFTNETMRKREVTMEHSKVPMIQWKGPFCKLSIIDQSNISKGSQSKEKQVIEVLCQKTLSKTYLNEKMIPKSPTEKEEAVLFSFEDEAIPKIENVKEIKVIIGQENQMDVTYQSTGEMINDICKYIESLKDKPITLEIINDIHHKLSAIDGITMETRKEIIDLLLKKLQSFNQIDKYKEISHNNNIQLIPIYQMNPINHFNPITQVNSMSYMNPMINIQPNSINTYHFQHYTNRLKY